MFDLAEGFAEGVGSVTGSIVSQYRSGSYSLFGELRVSASRPSPGGPPAGPGELTGLHIRTARRVVAEDHRGARGHRPLLS